MEERPKKKRIFVNNVDEYSSNNIAKFLAACEVSEDDDDDDEESSSTVRERLFHVVGTVSSSSNRQHFLHQEYVSPGREDLLDYLLQCDIVVYNISESVTPEHVEEAKWALSILHAVMNTFKSKKVFILVSTVMTWAATKVQEMSDTEEMLSDGDFRQRRPHPIFKNHHEIENLVLKLTRPKKSKLIGYVIAAGIQYGVGEHFFHNFFKTSWLMDCPKVPIPGEGTNYVPMIHVQDLAGVIQNVIIMKPRTKYIIAVDDAKNTLQEIVKSISGIVGPGKVYIVPGMDADILKDFQKEELELLTVNLRLDAFVVKTSLDFRWKYLPGMVENIDTIVKEYKDTRRLFPVKICLVGPPAVGKTTVATKLCRHYKIHHINVSKMIEDKISELNEVIHETDPEFIDPYAIADAQRKLDDITNSMELSEGLLAEEEVIELLQEKLNSQQCKNQGFVLENFPRTYKQAQISFTKEKPEDETSSSMVTIPPYDTTVTPEHIFVLNAADDFLIKRVQDLPQNVVEEMCYTMDEFVPRLNNYRLLCDEDETVLDFFDQREIHPEYLEVNDDDPEYKDVMEKITELVGVPTNYGLSPEEQAEEDQRKEEELRQKLEAEAVKRKLRKKETLAEVAKQFEQWQKNLSEVKREEQDLLVAQSPPLRNYLMKYVMPSMSEAMLECCKIKPDDPVDFLAEYLLHRHQQEE